MNTTLVINRKGGAGKTTVTINLASYFAINNVPTTIMDYDPQGSSLHWLKSRDPRLGKIHGSNAAPEKFGTLRSFGMYVPPETRQLIIDAPGGVSGVLLQEMLTRASCVLIPVTPSSIDIHATAGKGDVGFCNTWTLEISVKQAVRVYPDMPIGQLIYFEIAGEIDTPYSKKPSAKYNIRTDKPVESMMWKNFQK